MFNDSNLWCEDCERSNTGECNQHGPLLIVPDRPVVSRARQSLPDLLMLKEEEQGISVFAKETVKRRTRFGPLQARKVRSFSASEGKLEFKLFAEGKDPVYLNTSDEKNCNWMVFVRAAKEATEQNLVAFQYQSDIYFVTIKDIEPHTELKVWYAKEYAFSVGAEPLSRISGPSQTKPKVSRQLRPREKFMCTHCQKRFPSLGKVEKHVCSKAQPSVKESPGRTANEMPVRRPLLKKPEGLSKLQQSRMMVLRKYTKGSLLQSRLGNEQLPSAVLSQRLKKSKKDQKNEENMQRYETESMQRSVGRITKGGKHKCSMCEKEFSSPGKLGQHMYSHTGERPFKCNECTKGFSSKFKLMRHVLIHSNERKHKCSFCDRCFHRKDHLKNHMKIHNPNKKVYQCEKESCKKEYNSYLSFRKHIAVHAAEEGNLQCKICSKVFGSQEEILYHLKVHAGSRTVKNPSEKKFKCDFCERKFFTRKDVKRHLVVHTGNRDFLCQFCPQRFGRKDHLVRHIKKSHARARSKRDVKEEPRPSTSSGLPVLHSPFYLQEDTIDQSSVLQDYDFKQETCVVPSEMLAGPSSSSRAVSTVTQTPVLQSIFYPTTPPAPPPPYPSDIMDLKLYEDIKTERDLPPENVDISQLMHFIPSGNSSEGTVEPMDSDVLSPQEGNSGIEGLHEHPQLDLGSIDDLGISAANADLSHASLESQLLHLMQSSPSTLASATSSASLSVSSSSAGPSSQTSIAPSTIPPLLVPEEIESSAPSSSTPLPRFDQAFQQQQQ